MLEGLIAFGLHPDYLLAEHVETVLLIRCQLFAPLLETAVLRTKKGKLSGLLINLLT